MDGLTITQKIIARHAGRERVDVGEIVVVEVDLACIDDVQFHILRQRLDELALPIRDPDRVLLISDHYLPPSGVDEAALVRELALFGRTFELPTLLSDGVKHQVFIEKGLARPGSIVVATDSHTNTAGAVAALGMALGPTDVAAAFATGRTWLRVPPTIALEVHGELGPAVRAADVGLSVLAKYGRGFADYKVIEWRGATIEAMGLPGRMTLCNLTTEYGAKAGIVGADETTAAYARRLGMPDTEDAVSDEDAGYEQVLIHDARDFDVVVAAPPNPANVYSVHDLKGKRVDQAYIGTCTHGTLEDLAEAAGVLEGRTIHPRVRLLVTPATRGVYEAALRAGLLTVLTEAGATICSPGCGSCPGMHEGTLAEGEVRISTQNRNFVGRSGHPKAEIYLASPTTVASAALAGEIVHPASVMSGSYE